MTARTEPTPVVTEKVSPVAVAITAITSAATAEKHNRPAFTEAVSTAIRTVPMGTDRMLVVAGLSAAITPQHLAVVAPLAVTVPFGRDPRELITERLVAAQRTYVALVAAAERAGVTLDASPVTIGADEATAADETVARWSAGRGRGATGGTGTRTNVNRDLTHLVGRTLSFTYRTAAPVTASVELVEGRPTVLVEVTEGNVQRFAGLSPAAVAVITASGLFTGATPSANGWAVWQIDGQSAGDWYDAGGYVTTPA